MRKMVSSTKISKKCQEGIKSLSCLLVSALVSCAGLPWKSDVRLDCFLEVPPSVIHRVIQIYEQRDSEYQGLHVVTWDGDFIELRGPGWETLPDTFWKQGDRLISVDGCSVRDVVSFGPGEGSRDLAPMLDEGLVSRLNYVLAVPSSGWNESLATIVLERDGKRITIVVSELDQANEN